MVEPRIMPVTPASASLMRLDEGYWPAEHERRAWEHWQHPWSPEPTPEDEQEEEQAADVDLWAEEASLPRTLLDRAPDAQDEVSGDLGDQIRDCLALNTGPSRQVATYLHARQAVDGRDDAPHLIVET